MKTLTDAKEIEDALKGKEITETGIAENGESMEIYYKGGVISICIEAAKYVGVNDKLYVEVREDEKL